MPQGDPVIGRRLTVGPTSRRGLDDHIAARCSPAVTLFARVLLLLPPDSRVRQVGLRQLVRMGIEAVNRGDYDAAFAYVHPNLEMVAAEGVRILGDFPPVVRGRPERIRLERQWHEEWNDFRYEPEQVIDLTDRVLVLGRMAGSGPHSGAAVSHEWADLFTVARGRIVREQVFFSHADALAAAGLTTT